MYVIYTKMFHIDKDVSWREIYKLQADVLYKAWPWSRHIFPIHDGYFLSNRIWSIGNYIIQ